MRPDTAMTEVRVATVRSTPTGSSDGSSVAAYPDTTSRVRPSHCADWASSLNPSVIQPLVTRTAAVSGVRRSYGSRHHAASALWALAPTLLWAQGGPLGGCGRSR